MIESIHSIAGSERREAAEERNKKRNQRCETIPVCVCVCVCVCVSPRRYTHLDGGSSSFFSSFSSPFSFISHHLPFYSRNGRGGRKGE